MAASKLQAIWNHPAGPKTIHFWAPTFKWGISIANIADFSKPPEKLSYPQQVGMLFFGYMHWTDLVTLQHCNHSKKLEPFCCERCNGRNRDLPTFPQDTA